MQLLLLNIKLKLKLKEKSKEKLDTTISKLPRNKP